jgi:hypothetical protein
MTLFCDISHVFIASGALCGLDGYPFLSLLDRASVFRSDSLVIPLY